MSDVSVVEEGALHTRYVRIADRFKAVWTYHHFAAGAYRNFLGAPLPYDVDFDALYADIRGARGLRAGDADAALSALEPRLDDVSRTLLAADARITPPLLRRLFERLKRQDDQIIECLIRFYHYADAVEADHRDKLDFLFTRLGEDFSADRGEYVMRDALTLRERVIALVAILRVAEAPREEVVRIIRAIRSIRNDVAGAATFDDLGQRNLLRNARTFKHRVGDLYFDPDVLLAIVELNIATKNRFLALYTGEEQRIIDDAQKLMDHGHAIERNFGDTNPELVEEIARFRELRERFDSLRAQSNVKHDVIAQLKASMSNILAQLDRGLRSEEDAAPDLPASFLDETRQLEAVAERFGRDDVLHAHLLRIAAAVESSEPATGELRLEQWEVDAYANLFAIRIPEPDEQEELWTLFLRAAALRIKVDEEASILATAMAAQVKAEPELLANARRSLDTAKELDEQFGEALKEATRDANARVLRQLYRSRFRLLRAFAGLWLIYDRHT